MSCESATTPRVFGKDSLQDLRGFSPQDLTVDSRIGYILTLGLTFDPPEVWPGYLTEGNQMKDETLAGYNFIHVYPLNPSKEYQDARFFMLDFEVFFAGWHI